VGAGITTTALKEMGNQNMLKSWQYTDLHFNFMQEKIIQRGPCCISECGL
jgi:hypothetical protein